MQLTDSEEFRRIGAEAAAPMVSLWPKAQMSAVEFFRLGFRIALIPSSVSLAAVAAAQEMLLELKKSGTDHEYFARQKTFAAAAAWYKQAGSMPKQN